MPDDTSNSDLAHCLEWSRGLRTDFPAASTVAERFGCWVARTPEATAIREGNLRWSYADLAREAARAAHTLREGGITAGGFIGAPSIRSVGFVAAILGILEAGCAYLPIDPEEPLERRQLRERDCRATLSWKGSDEGGLAFTLEAASGNATLRPAEEVSAEPANRPAYLLYTSGSTGLPKGVVVPQRAILRLVCETDYLPIQPDDVFAFHSNISFDASTLEIWGPLLNGASLVVTATETVLSAPALAEHLREYGITNLWLTTSLFAQLAQEAPAMFGGLRALLFGGEAANAAAVRLVCRHGPPGRLINGYGPTETTTFAVCHAIDPSREVDDRVPIGRPIANTDAYILDDSLSPAIEGELYIGGPGVALGYHRAPELTAERFLTTPFGRLYRTGDLARWRTDGLLDYLGRKDRQIKIRGFRIEPGEVESAIRACPGVTDCAVLPSQAPSGEPCLVAYVVGETAPEALRRRLKAMLPAQMIPAALIRIERLPITPNGKLDPAALPPPFPSRPTAAPTAGSRLGETSLQGRLAAAWEEILCLPSVGLDDNFFDLGGTSLLLLRLHRRLRETLPEAAALRVVALFQHPTIRTLAQSLDAGRPAPLVSDAAVRAARQREAMARRRAGK